MKKVFALFFSLMSFLYKGNSQSYRQWADSANKLVSEKEFSGAIECMYRAAEINPDQKFRCFYNIACYASLAGNTELAFEKIFDVLNSDAWSRYNFITDKDFANVRIDKRWQDVVKTIDGLNIKRKEKLSSDRWLQEKMNDFTDSILSSWTASVSSNHVYEKLKSFQNTFPFNEPAKELTFYIKLSNGVEIPFFIQLPPGFKFQDQYSLHVTLHGGVRTTTIPEIADKNIAYRYIGEAFFEEAMKRKMITVVPFGDKTYNWWNSDVGFEIVPAVVKQMVKLFNIDEKKIFMTGHSNGASGATAYQLRRPDYFASFAAYNNNPAIITGGTFFKNAINRPFYNVSTDADYYFPYEGHLELENIANKSRIPWINKKYKGPHWFPFTEIGRGSYDELFNYLSEQKRNSFNDNIYWECDDTRFGKCDWLQINQLDTTAQKASWHQAINFQVSKWVRANNPAEKFDSTVWVFNNPKRSGAVNAHYDNNVFLISTSRVKEITIFISPEMVNINKPLKVFVNKKMVYSRLVKTNDPLLLELFKNNFDRQQLWINAIVIKI